MPSDFTECINPMHMDRCPLAQCKDAQPWLPSDPTCRKHCPGARVLLAAYKHHQQAPMAAGAEATLTHQAFFLERFALESSPFTGRSAWASLSENLGDILW